MGKQHSSIILATWGTVKQLKLMVAMFQTVWAMQTQIKIDFCLPLFTSKTDIRLYIGLSN